MATTHSTPETRQLEVNLTASKAFALGLCAFRECSNAVQAVIQEMSYIVNDRNATLDEREAAIATIAEALFPSGHDGTPGFDLEYAESSVCGDKKSELTRMDQEEATFADRLSSLLNARAMTQAELAEAIGVQQPAISMMLSRDCRPQKRTIERIARALSVSPADLWPGVSP